MLGKEKKIQQAKMNNARSRLELCNYLESLSARINNEYIRERIDRLKSIIESFPPCSDSRALVLDRKIQFIVERFRTQSFQYHNYLSDGNEEAQLRAEQYELGNKEIFDLILPVLENHLATRNRLMGDMIKSKKDLKHLTEYEKVAYNNDLIELKNLEERWNVDGTVLEYMIKYRKLFFEEQVLLGLHTSLLERAKVDKQSRANIIEQLEQLDRELERNRINQSVIAREMANNKDLRGMMQDLNVEEFVANNNYGQESFLNIYNKVAKKAQELAKKREESSIVISGIREKYDASRVNHSKTKRQNNEYYNILEEHDLASMQETTFEKIQESNKEKNKL